MPVERKVARYVANGGRAYAFDCRQVGGVLECDRAVPLAIGNDRRGAGWAYAR